MKTHERNETVLNILDVARGRYLKKLGYEDSIIGRVLGVDQSIVESCLSEMEPSEVPQEAINAYN